MATQKNSYNMRNRIGIWKDIMFIDDFEDQLLDK